MNDDLLEVEGFQFDTRKDAEQAKIEIKKIKYLNQNVNYANLEKVKKIYDKMLDERQFQTPIGWIYMMNLRETLINGGISKEDVRPIPLFTTFTYEASKLYSVPQRIMPAKKKKEPYKNRFITAVLLNILLIVCVVVMFLIALQGETPNIINYRNAITNEYSAWEQELTERENAVREKERELNIEWTN